MKFLTPVRKLQNTSRFWAECMPPLWEVKHREKPGVGYCLGDSRDQLYFSHFRLKSPKGEHLIFKL